MGQKTAHSGQLTAGGATASQLQIADWKIEDWKMDRLRGGGATASPSGAKVKFQNDGAESGRLG